MSRAIERIRAALRPTVDAPTPRETGAEAYAEARKHLIRVLAASNTEKGHAHLVALARAVGVWESDGANYEQIADGVLATPRPDAASASVTEIPRADLPKLDQPPESPGWRGDATVSAFRARLEVRIRETVDQVARVAGHAPGAKVNLKGFDSFLDCLCDAAAGAALAAAPRDAEREEVSEALHESVPEYAAGWEIGPEELNAASYWAHRYERLARAVAAARRGAKA